MAIERILVVDPDSRTAQVVCATVADMNCAVATAATASEALQCAASGSFELAILASGLDGFRECDALRLLRQSQPDLLVAWIKHRDDRISPTAEEAADAVAVFSAPICPSELLLLLNRATERLLLQGTARALMAEQHWGCSLLTGRSPLMNQLLADARRVAWSDAPILICGEPGTEKEPLARFVHAHSPRSAGPLFRLDCSQTRQTVSRLFGREADPDSGHPAEIALLELAAQGTVLLENFQASSAALQARLLRLLEENVYEREGGASAHPCSARIICSAPSELYAAALDERLRSDLFFRLAAHVLEIPPLRERLENLYTMSAAILRQLGAPAELLRSSVVERLSEHNWPGNVEELRSVLQIALFRSGGSELSPESLPLPGPAETAADRSAQSPDPPGRSRARHALARKNTPAAVTSAALPGQDASLPVN